VISNSIDLASEEKKQEREIAKKSLLEERSSDYLLDKLR
jgi:hypothetical protein